MKEISKGQKLVIKNEVNSDSFFVAFNWDDSNAKGYDIDLSIMLLSNTGKLENEEDFIFYNNPQTANGSVKIPNTPLTNYKKSSEITLSKLGNNISRIMFVITIDNGDTLNQRFGNVKNLTASLLDNSKNVAVEYKLDGLSQETAVITVEIYKHNNEWKYQSTGSGFNAGLDALLAQYGSDAIQAQESTTQAQQPVAQYIPTTPAITPTRSISTPSNYSSGTFQVVLALDISFSMSIMLRNGMVQTFVEKILDFSKKNHCTEIDVFPFHDEAFNHNVKISSSNINNFISREIVSKYFLGECYYEPVMKKIAEKHPNAGKATPPLLVVFLTDGDCFDKPNAEKIIKELSSKGIFWQFVAVGDKKSDFSFLNMLDDMSGRTVDNADFFYVENLAKLNHDDLEKKMLNEFPSWLQQTKSKGICN